MKVTVESIPEMTLEEFADKYGLEMQVVERNDAHRSTHMPRYFASFKGVEFKDCGCLLSFSGNGDTIESAIEDYRANFKGVAGSGGTMVIDAMKPSRREITLPRLIPSSPQSRRSS